MGSRGQAAVEFKELIHAKSKKITMGSNNLWTRLSFAILLGIVTHTMARPSPWFGESYENGFDKPQDSKNVETNIDIKRPNSRMIDEREVSSSGSRFWDDLAPIFPPRRDWEILLQSFLDTSSKLFLEPSGSATFLGLQRRLLPPCFLHFQLPPELTNHRKKWTQEIC